MSEPLKEAICFSADQAVVLHNNVPINGFFLIMTFSLLSLGENVKKKKRCTIRKRNSYQECKGHERPIFSAEKAFDDIFCRSNSSISKTEY